MAPPLDASKVKPRSVKLGGQRRRRALRVALLASVALHVAVTIWSVPTVSAPPPEPLLATITVVSAPQAATASASAAETRADAAQSPVPAKAPAPLTAQAPAPTTQALASAVAPSAAPGDSRATVAEGRPPAADSPGPEPTATRSEHTPDAPAETPPPPEASPAAVSAPDPAPVGAPGPPLDASGKDAPGPVAASADNRANGAPGEAASGAASPPVVADRGSDRRPLDPGEDAPPAPRAPGTPSDRPPGNESAPGVPSTVAPQSAARDVASLEGTAPASANVPAPATTPLADNHAESVSPPVAQPAPPLASPGAEIGASPALPRPTVFIVYLRPATAPPQFPTQVLPLRVDLTYKLFLGQGMLIGEGTYSFERTGDAYHIVGAGQARGFVAAIAPGQGKLESRGVITSIGLQPQEFSIERGSPAKREIAEFDWGTGIVDLHEHKLEQFDPWTSDPLAFMWQFHFSPPRTDELSLSVATTRHIYRATVSREGTERIAWSHGAVNTEIWHRRSDDGKSDSYVWLAPSLHYVPVKVRVVVANIGTVEAMLETARVEEAPAK